MTLSEPAAWAPPSSGAGGATGSDAEARVNPYVGPRALRAGEMIHGRSREIADIRGLLMAHRIVLVYSPSGAGKTSLIDAGLRPEMEQRGFTVLPTIRVGHELTGGADRPGQNRYCASVISCLEERRAPEDQLTPDDVASTDLADYLNQLAGSDPDENLCLFFDQFEELFTMNPADVEAKEAFLEQLGTALKDRRFWVLIAMREDFIAHLDPHVELLPTRLKTRFRLDLLSPEAAKEAARAPAVATGVEFEEAAVEKLIDDLRQIQVQHLDETTLEPGPHVEPLQLQIVCRRLWTPTTTSIGVDDLDNLGGVDEALALYYHDALDRTVSNTSVSEKALRSWFENDLITTDGFRRPVRKGPGKDRGKKVMNELEGVYLIRKDRRNGTDWYELTHDRIVKPIRDSNRKFRSRRRTRRRWIGVATAAVAVVVGAAALVSFVNDDARRLSATEADIPSETEVPALEPGGFARFLISPEEGDIISVTLTAQPDVPTSAKLRLVRVVDGELDAELASDSLRVVGPDSAKNEGAGGPAGDISGPDNVALTQRQVTDQDLSIVVEVSTQSGGSYQLAIDTVDEGSGAAAPLPPLGTEPVDGRIEAAGVVSDYVIESGIEGVVRFVVTPLDESENGFDTVVTLDGGIKPVVQDTGGPGQAEVLVATLDADSSYVLEVSGYEGSTGGYTVALERVTTTALAIGADTVDGRVADVGGAVTYSLADADGGDVRVVVTPRNGSVNGLDAAVTMRDPDGVEVAFADIAGPGQPEVLNATLAPGVEYLVDVSGFDDSTGDFGVSAGRFTTTPLALGVEAMEGRIADRGEIVTYAVSEPDGADVRLVVRPTDESGRGLDPLVTVRDVQGLAVSASDQGGAGQAETLVAILAADSEYLVDVSGFESSTGDFVVSLERIGATPLELGAPIEGTITNPEEITNYAVTIPADVEIDTIEVVPSPDLDVRVELATPYGNLPIDERGAGEPEGLDWAEFGVGAFPEEQRWVISVWSSDGSVGGYEISVTSAG